MLDHDRDAPQGGQIQETVMLSNLWLLFFGGWSWDEIVRVNESIFSAVLIMVATCLAGALNITR
jgi:hypothetical protein